MRNITFSKETVENVAVIGGFLVTMAAIWFAGGYMRHPDLKGIGYIIAAMTAVGGLLLSFCLLCLIVSKMRSRRQRW